VKPATVDYFTQARTTSDIRISSVHSSKFVTETPFYVGGVIVTERVVAYARKSISTGEILGVIGLDLPEQVLSTIAFWYTLGEDLVRRARIAPQELPGALHAAEHAAIGILPLFAMADRWDIGGVSTALAIDTGLPTVFIYDGYPGGAGIAERGFEHAEEHLRATLQAVRECVCATGCPSCVQSPKCGNGNEPLDKAAAVGLMDEILAAS
jgi:DEAD/DEAH box helicase domain-containing protein